MTDPATHAVLQLSDGALVCVPRTTRPQEPYREVVLGSSSECESFVGRARSEFLYNRGLLAKMQNYEPRPEAARRVAFLKLQKTGGTSFASCVLFPYCVKHRLPYMVPVSVPRWGITLANSGTGGPSPDFHMLFRHAPDYALRRNWLEERLGSPKVVTIVRDPVSRAISLYRHHRHHDGWLSSFDEFLDTTYVWNQQSRWLGFSGTMESLSHIDVVGVCERFNESMLCFARALQLETHDFLYVRQRDLRTESVTLEERQTERIRQGDELDCRLHQLATRRLQMSLSNVPGIADQLGEYEEALGNLKHPLWRRRGPFKIGYIEGCEWAEVTAEGNYRQLKDIGG